MSWWEWIVAVTALPLNFFLSTLYELFEGIFSLFGGEPHPPVTDARGDVARFVAAYTEHYAPQAEFVVPFLNEPFAEACQRAKSSLRPLLVLLHSESHAALVAALSSQAVGEVVQQKELLVWGVSTASPEGKRVAHQLRARSLPSLLLMVPREGRLVSSLRLGEGDAGRLASALLVGVALVEQHLRQMRAQQQRRLEDTRIRAEQEEEYKEALAADRKKKEDAVRKEKEKKQKEEEERKAERQREELLLFLETKKQQLRGERPAAVEGEAVRVQIRFPSGAKAERKFSVSDSVESLFNEVLLHAECPSLFSLFTNFPRRPLPFAPSWYLEWRRRAHPADSVPSSGAASSLRSFREEGLSQSLVVMVQDDSA